ncbi:MAG: hypothetical protein JXA11_02990 [Phycisphaerae bacterium]|nr:hypothetical protein [Phycisphaerae bacterium]
MKKLEPMTEDDFQRLLDHPKWGRYYDGRWEYYRHVVDFVRRIEPESVLEVGPGQHIVVKGCDVMVTPEDDAWGRPTNEVGKPKVLRTLQTMRNDP